MVDKVGLRNVLWALAHISRAKAHHIEGNGDKNTAKTWMHDALKLSRCAQRLGESKGAPRRSAAKRASAERGGLGRAAAPAARRRKFRRGSFSSNLSLWSLYSITSSAATSKPGGAHGAQC
jgi:hypothetical protein